MAVEVFELNPVSRGGKAKFNLAVTDRMDLEREDNRDTRNREPREAVIIIAVKLGEHEPEWW